MPLIKTLSQALERWTRKASKYRRSVQQAIPIQRIWPDGIFHRDTNFPGHSGLRISTILLQVKRIRRKCSWITELLNALDSGFTAKITLNNRRINKEEFEAVLLPDERGRTGPVPKRIQRNAPFQDSGTNNSIYQERYLTVSVHKKNIDEARTYFARVGTDIITHLASCPLLGKSWMQSRGYRSSGTFSRQTFHRVFHLT